MNINIRFRVLSYKGFCNIKVNCNIKVRLQNCTERKTVVVTNVIAKFSTMIHSKQ